MKTALRMLMPALLLAAGTVSAHAELTRIATALSLASDRDLTNIVLKEADRLAGPTKLEQEAAKDMRADMYGENGNG